MKKALCMVISLVCLTAISSVTAFLANAAQDNTNETAGIVSDCTHTETHTYVLKKATCSESGIQVTICDICNETISTEEIDATGHHWDEGIITITPACNSQQ